MVDRFAQAAVKRKSMFSMESGRGGGPVGGGGAMNRGYAANDSRCVRACAWVGGGMCARACAYIWSILNCPTHPYGRSRQRQCACDTASRVRAGSGSSSGGHSARATAWSA